jgi:hypothetical protein
MFGRMLNIRKIFFILLLLLFSLTSESQAMKLLYYDISFTSRTESKYGILPNGIVQIEHNDSIIFVRPANKVFVAEGQQLWLWPSRKNIPELFFSEWYYPEDSSLMSKPDYFYIEILLYSKKDGYVLYPKKLKVINSRGELIPAVKYIVVEKLLEKPSNYGDGNLLNFTPLDGNQFSLEREREENISIKIPVKKLIGFAVRFNIPPPSPGDLFTIEIEGIEYMGELIHMPTITYDTKKTYTFSIQ